MLTMIQNKKHTSVHVPPLRLTETQTHVQDALVAGDKPKATIQCDGRKTEQCIRISIKTNFYLLLIHTASTTATVFTPTERVIWQGGSKHNRDDLKYSGLVGGSREQRTPEHIKAINI